MTLTFQSSVVTSLFLSSASSLTCFSTSTLEGPLWKLDLLVISATVQIRAVESPDLDRDSMEMKIKENF